MVEITKIQVCHPSIRWRLKQAAAERRMPQRELATEILAGWLARNGYGIEQPTTTRPDLGETK